MKLKLLIIFFFFGIIIGVAISPLTNTKPQNIFLSPLPDTKAQSELNDNLTNQSVLGVNEEKSVTASPAAISQFGLLINQQDNQNQQPSPSPQFPSVSQYQGTIKIAIYGDSMTDVMATGLPYLKTELEKFYPRAKYSLYNYGIGAQNIETGLERLNQPLAYKDRQYPPLLTLNPDIIILDPFNYNPFPVAEDELFRHWAGLSKITDELKNSTTSQIIILATIAPNKAYFGQGPGGVNWSKNSSWQQAVRIEKLLENTINFSTNASLPVVDAFHPTTVNKDGNLEFINSNDHIHQNEAGNKLIARLLAEKIFSFNLFR